MPDWFEAESENFHTFFKYFFFQIDKNVTASGVITQIEIREYLFYFI